MVTGLSDFPHYVNKKEKRKLAPLDGYAYVIPDTIREIYSIPKTLVGGKNPSNIQVALEFAFVGFPSTKDWHKFTTESGEIFQNYSKVIGVQDNNDPGESTLDVQYLAAIGSNISTWYWTISDGWAYEMALDIFNAPAPNPSVVSVSYGWMELDTCDSSVTNANCTGMDTVTYVNRANVEFMKTGLLRISFLIASQDEGAPSDENIDCSLDSTSHPVFGIYPCSSPYVTCVSATTVGPETNPTPPTTPKICTEGFTCAQSNHEVPCSVENTEYSWTTGGGFSEFAPRPSYQDAVVTAYLQNTTVAPPSNKFNNSQQRGYPEVSTVGDRILIIEQGSLSITAGTSASTPIFAGIVSLLNDYRIGSGKTALGFLNPLLYQMAADKPTAFNDVTEGDNRCSSGVCCQYGFAATAGWDAVSGLGTPHFPDMLAYVQSLQN
jgi:tripeptidyl-peptidase-1